MRSTDATDALLKATETRIQALLLRLNDELEEDDLKIDGVSVDTRNFGNLKCEVLVASRRK